MSDIYAVSAVKRIFKIFTRLIQLVLMLKQEKKWPLLLLKQVLPSGNASVTIIHGMSRPIGALFHVPHGLSNAMLLNVCLGYIKPDLTTRLCKLTKEIGVFRSGMTPDEGAQKVVVSTKELLRSLNIQTPEVFCIDKEEFFKQIPKMAENALISGVLKTPDVHQTRMI